MIRLCSKTAKTRSPNSYGAGSWFLRAQKFTGKGVNNMNDQIHRRGATGRMLGDYMMRAASLEFVRIILLVGRCML
jgi:hypothetical protein